MEKIEWTPYLATAYAEGFCEGEGASQEEQLEAWAYLIKTGLCWNLQGWFGRTAKSLIDNGLISEDGEILFNPYKTNFMKGNTYTKESYKDAVQKKAVRDFMFSHFQFNKIVGLPGPDIQHYINWCKSRGYSEIEAWEYEPLVAIKQLGELSDGISYNMGDVLNAELRDDAVYDLDYCKTIRNMKDHITKFRKNFVMTFSRRLKGFSPEMFFEMINERILSSKEYKSPVVHTVFSTNEGKYIYAPYYDTSAMFSIAKIK